MRRMSFMISIMLMFLAIGVSGGLLMYAVSKRAMKAHEEEMDALKEKLKKEE